MNPLSPGRFLCSAGAVAAYMVALAAPPVADDPEGRALVQSAQQRVTAYHAGQPRSDAVLRVVYFCPNDRDPLPNYAERLDRAMADVSDFYRDGLRRFGVANDGLPLERKDGRLVLHRVRGQRPASAYSYESGDELVAEIRAAVKESFDLDREHVLAIYALCRKERDGRYVFDSPYYGGGTQRSGFSHAADCELLDPRLLTQSGTKMVFKEHYYSRMDTTVANFNSMYLGGIAHELGHGLGLPHDAGMAGETPAGTSLMGMGNLRYRTELWGGEAPAYLSRVTALQFLSHPFVTGSNRGRFDEIVGGLSDVTFTSGPGALHLRGKAGGSIPPYAAVAYVRATTTTDHTAQTFPVVLKKDAFELDLTGLHPASYYLRLGSFHVNGGVGAVDYHFGFDAAGRPETPQAFVWPWVVARAEAAVLARSAAARELLTDQAIAETPAPDDRRRLRTLRQMLDPPAPVDLGQASGDAAWLSDARWSDARVGWGRVARNSYWFDDKIQDGVFLLLGGQCFDKGLYAHAPSRYVFDLGQKWRTLAATVGLRDGAPGFGSAIFRVLGDGRELFRSPVLRAGERANVSVALTGVKKLELLAEGGQGNNGGAWAIWAAPEVRR